MAVSPDFVNYNGPDGDPLAGGDSDYHLNPTSGLLDVGIASYATYSLTAPSDDIEGVARPQGSGYDIGAYEYLVTTPTYTLTASVFGGNGSISPTNGTYLEDMVVSLTADPDTGYRVASWSGTDDDNSTASTNTVTMSSDKTVTVEFEWASCTDPNDADTDDDGIPDEEEDANGNGIVDAGETNPCLADTDGDGIQDGTESGVTVGTADTNPAVFVPDLDPATTTNPLLADSDGDGILDGLEDSNQNGRVDAGESDPNTPDAANKAMPWIPLLLLGD